MGLHRKYTVLVVEYDAEIASCYQQFLNNNYTILVTSSGRNAVDMVRSSHAIDIVVLDQSLPDLSGIEVLQEIKRHKPHIPVLFVTAHEEADLAVQAYRCGADDYIKKPFSLKELLDLIDSGISNASRRKRRLISDRMAGPGSYGPGGYINRHEIQEALKYIHCNSARNIGLEDTANFVRMNPQKFSELFKNVLGMSYDDYLDIQRIEHAKILLKSKNCTLKEIARAAGYEDLGHFIRLFKKIVGTTPSEYAETLIG